MFIEPVVKENVIKDSKACQDEASTWQDNSENNFVSIFSEKNVFFDSGQILRKKRSTASDCILFSERSTPV